MNNHGRTVTRAHSDTATRACGRASTLAKSCVPIHARVSESTNEYVMAREKALAAANEASELLTLFLLSAYTDGVDEAGARFSSWAMSAASDIPERRWGALQACATFARGILIDAGEMPGEVVAEIARDKNVAEAIDDPMEEAGVHDALEILGTPGEAEADSDERWLSYASDDCPTAQYVAALTFMFFLAVAAAPAAAARLSQ